MTPEKIIESDCSVVGCPEPSIIGKTFHFADGKTLQLSLCFDHMDIEIKSFKDRTAHGVIEGISYDPKQDN